MEKIDEKIINTFHVSTLIMYLLYVSSLVLKLVEDVSTLIL